MGVGRVYRGWTVVIACFFVYLSIGIAFSYTEFFLPIAREFGRNYSTSSTIPAASTVASSLGSLLGGYIVPRFGYRRICIISSFLVGGGTLLSGFASNFVQIFVPFGLLASIGNSFMLVASTSLVVNWFIKDRGIAVGVMTSGSGAGAILVPWLADFTINLSGWRVAMFLIGGLFLILLLVASLFLQMPQDVQILEAPRDSYQRGGRQTEKVEARKEVGPLTLNQCLHSGEFWILYVMLTLGTIGVYVFTVHAVPFAEFFGINSLIATEAVMLFGCGSLFSRIIVGAFLDRLKPAITLVVSFGIGLCSLSILTFFPSVTNIFLVGAVGIGFAYGGFIAEFVVLAGDLFSVKLIPKVWGVYETALVAGGLVGPITAGILFDRYHSYILSFELACLSVGIAFGLSLIFLVNARRRVVLVHRRSSI